MFKTVRSLILTIFFVALLTDSVAAISKNSCTQGSDNACARYGANMCCARIIYSFSGNAQDFHACANRPGIEMADGKIFDQYGFSGRWYCDGAIQNYLSTMAPLAASLLLIFAY